MKTIFKNIQQALAIVAIFVFSNQAIAQAPDKMSYQTVIRNSSNALVTSSGVGIQISILQGSSSGTAVYVERHFPNTNANGLASIEIGSGTVISGAFSSIDWANGPYFILTETDPNGGSNYTITGTSELLSVPYALHAGTADALVGGIPSNWTTSGNNIYNANSGNIGIGTTNPNAKLHVNGILGMQDGTEAFCMKITNGQLQFHPNNYTGTGTASLTIDDDTPNIGIGTSSPLEKLTVLNGNIAVHKVAPNNSLIGRVKLGNPNYPNSWAGLEAWQEFGSDQVSLSLMTAYGSTVSRLYIEEQGNIGIATTSPSYKLHVNGSAGKPGGGSWTAASDKRLKSNIVDYNDGLQSLLAIRPVKFHYNEKSGMDTQKEYIGVIAQDLKEVAPYMVGSFEQDGTTYFDVDNSAMTYMLINSVKEQQAQIASLTEEKANSAAKIAQLEKQLAELSTKIEALLLQK